MTARNLWVMQARMYLIHYCAVPNLLLTGRKLWVMQARTYLIHYCTVPNLLLTGRKLWTDYLYLEADQGS